MTRVGVALFFTTSAVMQAEKILQRQGIPVRLIPTPRTLSSDCGIAVSFGEEHLERARILLLETGLESAGIHAVAEADL